MDSKLLLIRVITLLFLESQGQKANNNSSRQIATTAMEYIKVADAAITAEFSRDSTSKLVEIARWMINESATYQFDRTDVLTRVRIATETEEYIYDAFESAVLPERQETEIKELIRTNREAINQFVNRAQVMGIVKNAYTMTHFKPDSVDWGHFAKDLIAQLEPYKTLQNAAKHQLIESVDLNNQESLQEAFKMASLSVSTEGVFRFGWQGLNRMFGDQEGARRGEMICVAALQHNFKSGFVLEMLKSAALYNKPFLYDKTRKPLLLRISLENSTLNDIIHLYKSLIEPEIGMKIDTHSIDPIAAACYVNKRLTETGWNIRLEHYNPSDFTIFDLIDVIEKYENEGFEVCMLNIDYLAMMSTKGCKQGATGQDIRDLFRRTRNLCESKRITCITPAQLSTEAKKLTRQGIEDFVKEIANKGYYDSCSTIDQELDMEIYIYLVKVNGETYLTCQRGKHRKPTITPYQDHYFVYKFHPDRGYIDDDVLGADQSRRRVAGGTVASGGEPAWFDMAA